MRCNAAKLFLEGFGEYVVFAGNGRERITEHIFDKSEAETFPFGELGDALNDKHYVIASIVGDLQRTKLYSEQGHQIPQTIPQKVWPAYEQLVAAGYNRRLVRPHSQS